MSLYYVRQDGGAATGPYEAETIRGWLAAGQVSAESECSRDGVAWWRASELADVGGHAGGTTPPPAAAPTPAFPEMSLLVRQGVNVQGPFRLSRIKGYVAQRRVQPYMLFSQDGVFWVDAQHVPGLIPEGYVPVAPGAQASVVPDAPPASGAARPRAPSIPAGAPAAGDDVGSITLTGFRLSEAEMAAPSSPAPRASAPPRTARPVAPAVGGTYYVRRDGRDVYGPVTEDVVRDWIAEGRVGPESEYSTDGRVFTIGSRMPELFAGAGRHGAARPDDDRARRPRYRH